MVCCDCTQNRDKTPFFYDEKIGEEMSVLNDSKGFQAEDMVCKEKIPRDLENPIVKVSGEYRADINEPGVNPEVQISDTVFLMECFRHLQDTALPW